MKENKIWNDYLPEDMQEHWTVYECLKESEDSSTFLVKETATGILCVLKWGRNRQAEFLRNEMEIMKKWRIGNCPGFQRHTGYSKKMAKCIW